MKDVALAGAILAAAARSFVRGRRRMELRGAVVLVTGASRGLGFLVAREFARAGARLVVCARDADELAHAAGDLALETDVLAVSCDVGDRGQVDRLVRNALGRFGRVDVLVNNAGVIEVGPLDTVRCEDFERALDVMFWGIVHTTLALLPGMRARRRGRIVNVTSIGGRLAVPHLLPYVAAKFAAVGLSEGLHAELARDGIRVVTIVPGLMRTGSHLHARFRGRQQREYAWFALGASLPFVSMDAERAAREIVEATRRGDAVRILSLPARVAAVVHGVMPGLTVELLALVNRLLPAADGAGRAVASGGQVQRRLGSRVLDAVTRLGERAARRFHQHPERLAG